MEKISKRLAGFPRTLHEIDRSLNLLATMRALGWHSSIKAQAPVDHAGEPLPWLTYPAIEWLKPRVSGSLRVFEFGAGFSTLWFARHAMEVTSVEHDARWAQRLQELLPDNATLILCPTSNVDDSPYVRAIDRSTPLSFDIIVIDGQQRSACAKRCLPYLKEDGLIVFDNSDRPENREGGDALIGAGLFRLDFLGFVPGYGHLSCTSIFSRNHRTPAEDRQYPNFLGH